MIVSAYLESDSAVSLNHKIAVHIACGAIHGLIDTRPVLPDFSLRQSDQQVPLRIDIQAGVTVKGHPNSRYIATRRNDKIIFKLPPGTVEN